jgi:CHAT domain-containing protein/tetratricopeptide (TPR) repeat protein
MCQPPAGASAQAPAPEAAAIERALESCRQGRVEQAVERLAADLQRLPQGYRAADLLVRLARRTGLDSRVLEAMELWTIPPESTEIGLPSAWLNLRGRLLRRHESEIARNLLIQTLGKSRPTLPGAVEELAQLADEGRAAELTQELRDLGATPANLALLGVHLADRRARPDLAIALLAPLIRAEPDLVALRLLQVRLLRRLDRIAEAVDAADEALVVAKRSGAPEDLAEMLVLYGEVLASAGRGNEAERAYALAEDSARHSCDAQLAARAEVARGELLRAGGEILAAESMFQTALQLEPENADARAALARLLEMVGEPGEALAHYEAAEQGMRSQDRRRDLALLQADWARAAAGVGLHADALRHQRSALESAAAVGDRTLACGVLLDTARTWLGLRQPGRARAVLDAAAAVAAEERSVGLQAAVDCAQAEALTTQGAPQESLVAAGRCRTGAERVRDERLGLRARTLSARALNDLGRSLEAVSALGAEPAAETGDDARDAEARVEWLLELGRAEARSTGRAKEAAAALKAASDAASGLGRTDVPWRAEREIAGLELRLGRIAEATAALERAVALLEESRADVGPPGMLPDRSTARLEPYAALAALLVQSGSAPPAPAERKGSKRVAPTRPDSTDAEWRARAWEIADRRLGRRLRDLLPRVQEAAATSEERRLVAREVGLARQLLWVRAAQASSVLSPPLRYQLERWTAAAGLPQVRVESLRAAARGEGSREELSEFLEQVESRVASEQRAALAEIAGASPRLAVFLTPRPATLHAVQSALSPDEALVLYVCGDEEILALVATRDRFSVSHLSPWRDLAGPAADLQQQLSRAPRPGQTFRPESGAVLYRSLVLTPLIEAGLVSPPAKLVLVGDGPLMDVPFAALPRPGGGFLIDGSLPVLLPGSWWRLEQAPTAGLSGAPTLLGSPFLPAASAAEPVEVGSVSVPGEAFRIEPNLGSRAPRNPSSSAVEVQAAARRLGADARLLVEGAAAEEEITNAALGGASVLHLAAPAFGDGLAPRGCGVLLGRREGGPADGLLDLFEILRLRLGARLVTLSGSEPLSPGGTLDLATGFLVAGSRAVIASMWLPEEDANVYLMDRLYERLAEAGPGAALREAQMHLLSGQVLDHRGRTLKRLAHPHYWASYVLVGLP